MDLIFIHLLLIFATINLCLCDFKLLLLHTNDMHSRFKEVNRYLGRCGDKSSQCYGGFARLRYVAQQKMKEAEGQGRSTIFLNAGDSFQGTPYYNIFKWRIVAELISAMGINAVNLGNHEFDDGIEGLVPYINQVNVPVVCCNLDLSQEPTLKNSKLKPSTVITIKGIKIGVIGYITPEMTRKGTGRLTFLDEIPSIRAEAQNLLKDGVKILIALGHSGFDKDLEIAREVEEIDVIVGAHSHTFLYSESPPDVEVPTGPYPTVITHDSGKKVPVVQAYCGTKYLGHLELDFDDVGNLISFNGVPILLSGDYPQDSHILNLLEKFDYKKNNNFDHIIGRTNVFLDNSFWKCRTAECNVGNVITDAFADYASRHCHSGRDWTEPVISLCHGGGIRASIDALSEGRDGSLTVEDVMTVIPFENRIVVVELTGQVIREILEKSVARYDSVPPQENHEFLQVSGLRITYRVNRKVGKRLASVKVRYVKKNKIRFRRLIKHKIYRVALPDFLIQGNEGYSMLTGLNDICKLPDVDYKVVSDYIKAHSPLHNEIEKRIVIKRDGYIGKMFQKFLGLFL